MDKLETMESRLLDRSKGLAQEDHGELGAGDGVTGGKLTGVVVAA
nr:hypothetical protein [Collinsella tanakaei]